MRINLLGLLLALASCRVGGDPPSTSLVSPLAKVELRGPAQSVEDPRVDAVAQPLPPLAFSSRVTPIRAEGMAGLRDVLVQLSLQGAVPNSQLAVEFLSPGGMPYERRERSIEGGGLQVHDFLLPVAGTFIESAGLTGSWSARFFLDGVELTTADFEVAP